MKMPLKSFAVCAAGFLLAGCLVRSTEPWLSDDTRVSTPSLAGTWQDAEQNLTVIFMPEGSNYHALAIGADTNVTPFTVALHHVDNEYLMTVGPAEAKGLGAFVQVPVYLLFKAELKDDALRLFAMDVTAAETRFKTAGAAIRFTGSKEKGYLALSSTPELTAFARSQLTSPGFFNLKPLYQLKHLSARVVPGAANPPAPTPPY